MRYRLLVVGILLFGGRAGVWARAGGADATRQTSPATVRRASSDARRVTRDETNEAVRRWLSEDLRLKTGDLLDQKVADKRHVLVCRDGFAMTIAAVRISGSSAVVHIDGSESSDPDVPRYTVLLYLRDPTLGKAPGGLDDLGFEAVRAHDGEAVVLKMEIDGEIYVTAETRKTGSPQGLLLYRQALDAFEASHVAGHSSLEARGTVASDEPRSYTVTIAALTDRTEIESETTETGKQVVTFIGRVYARWQEPDPEGGLPRTIELQADNIVFWRRSGEPNAPAAGLTATQQRGVTAIYVAGDVLVMQGERTIQASEFYYDLDRRRGIAKDGVLRTFDAARGIPIYVRADELRQIAADEFEATDVSISVSEFRTPQLSLSAARMHMVDKTHRDPPDDSDFDARMEDIRFKYYDTTLFAWPSLRSDGRRPDLPIRGISAGNDGTYGTSVETSWYLSRLLGLQEPEGTDGTLQLDYYSKRGPGAGVDIAYERENYFGRVIGYIIHDRGEDRLSRTQLNVPVPQETRGRFELRHRHFLSDSWQLTAEVGYLSDQNFLQQYYRSEFYAGKEQETLLHLKRIEDNWGLAFLGKVRVNDFLDQVEELPSGELHWTGESLFGDRFTFYSNSQASRYQYRYRSGSVPGEPEGSFTYLMTRNELDAPLSLGKSKVVPFIAATMGYDDGAGFQVGLDDVPLEPQDLVTIGEAGVRFSTQPFWRVYPDVKSEFWDIDQLRHIIRPEALGVVHTDSDPVVQQRDVLNVGLYQRWQTKRGPVGRQRTVDWLRWNIDLVWLSDSGDAPAGPDQFLWNQPLIPLANRTAMALPPQDRRTTGRFGPQRDYIGTDVLLRLTDTTSILGDMYVDMQSGVVQQVNMGFSRLCRPNLSYYIGSRYLRRPIAGQERSSNAVTFAATYRLDPRYTLVFSEQYDFGYGAGIQSDITLIRKYHRMNLALTVSSDEALDEKRIVLSLWPQGVSELGLGPRRYMDLGATDVY